MIELPRTPAGCSGCAEMLFGHSLDLKPNKLEVTESKENLKAVMQTYSLGTRLCHSVTVVYTALVTGVICHKQMASVFPTPLHQEFSANVCFVC